MQRTKNKNTRKRIFIHLLIWIAFITVSLFQSYYDRGVVPKKLLIILTSVIISFYVNYIYLVPKLLLKKKIFQYIFSLMILTTLIVYLTNLVPFEPPPIKLPPNIKFPADFPKPQNRGLIHFDYILPLFFNLAFIVIGTSVRMYEEWNKNERKKHEIERQKKTTELHFLRNQLNPHFLFNSLNSIYSLTNKKSNDAPEAVLTLSELMRYMLYKTDNDFVLLKDELEYIQNYLKLQRLRIANNENITMNIHGDIKNQKIRPLLLISFIENAFKHGTDFMGNTEVSININIDKNHLQFSCINLIGNKKKNKEQSGIGLQNTKERLELLYPDKHILEVKERDNKFIVNLTLNLE